MSHDPVSGRPKSKLARAARLQHGLVTRQQALTGGLTRDALRHLLRRGGWQRVLPGVYATFTGDLSTDALDRAAILYAGPGALLTGVSACRRYGLRYVPEDKLVHVLVAHGRRPASRDFVRVQRTHNLPRPWLVGRLHCAPLPRAALDATRPLRSLQDVRALLCDVVQRLRVPPELLVDELARGPTGGSALPRRALADLLAGCWSAPECDLREVVRSSRRLPEPRWNAPVHASDGTLLGVADGWWAEVRVALEVNSREHHFYADAWERTMQRQAAFAAAGILVVPVSPARLRREPREVLREIEGAYLTRWAA